MVTIGILEFDKISHVSFDTFLRGAAAPIDPLGRELRLPLGKFFRPTDVEPYVAQTPVPKLHVLQCDADTDPASHT